MHCSSSCYMKYRTALHCISMRILNSNGTWVTKYIKARIRIKSAGSQYWGLVQSGIFVQNSSSKSHKISFAHYFQIAQSLWYFAQYMAVILSCSVQIFWTNGRLKGILWTNEIWRYMSLRWVWDGYSTLHSIPGSELHHCAQQCSTISSHSADPTGSRGNPAVKSMKHIMAGPSRSYENSICKPQELVNMWSVG